MNWPIAHRCPWPGCTVKVAPDLWGCKSHWFQIPRDKRIRLWKAYRAGQTMQTASAEYVEAAQDIHRWMLLQVSGEREPMAAAPRKGHGHVIPNADGSRTRCGGPRICHVCQREAATLSKKDDRQGELL